MSILQTISNLFGPNKKVHDIKNQYTSEILRLDIEKRRMKKDLVQSQRQLEEIAYRLGVAAGRIQ